MPKKPIKRGFKVWVRAEADIGYVSEFEVYTGKKDDGPEKNLGTKVVKNLTSKVYSKYHHIYFDNYFSSVDLMLDLLRNGTYSTGTLQSNRKGFPQDFKKYLKTGLPERGDYKTVQCGPVSITLWQQYNLIYLLFWGTEKVDERISSGVGKRTHRQLHFSKTTR